MMPPAPATRPPKRTPPFRKMEQMQTVATLGYVWRTELSRPQKAAWAALARVTPGASTANGGKPVSAYLLFFQTNTARLAQKLPTINDAWEFPDLPPFLGKVTVSAFVTPQNTARFTLSGVDFPHAVQVFASKPLLSEADASDATRLVLLTTLPQITSSGVEVSDDGGRLGRVEAGDAFALQFVPLSQAGFRGPAQKTTCAAAVFQNA